MNESLLCQALLTLSHLLLEGKILLSHFSGEGIGSERFCHLRKDTKLEIVELC